MPEIKTEQIVHNKASRANRECWHSLTVLFIILTGPMGYSNLQIERSYLWQKSITTFQFTAACSGLLHYTETFFIGGSLI